MSQLWERLLYFQKNDRQPNEGSPTLLHLTLSPLSPAPQHPPDLHANPFFTCSVGYLFLMAHFRSQLPEDDTRCGQHSLSCKMPGALKHKLRGARPWGAIQIDRYRFTCQVMSFEALKVVTTLLPNLF